MRKITQFLRNNQRRFVTGGGLLVLSSVAGATDLTPSDINDLFTNLGDTVATLLTATAVLYAAIKGGTAVFKIASKFFGAAGA
jgi:hypothetical protein